MFTGLTASLLAGPEIIVSELLGKERKQIRFPRTKNKRIRRKWAKNPRNWRETWKRGMYQVGRTFVCDPVSYAELKARVGGGK